MTHGLLKLWVNFFIGDKINPKSNVFTPAVKNLATADCKHDSTEDCALFLENGGLVKIIFIKGGCFPEFESHVCASSYNNVLDTQKDS